MAFEAVDIAGTATVDHFAAEPVDLVVDPAVAAVVVAVVLEELVDCSSCSIDCKIADYTGRPGFAFAVRPMVVGVVVAFAAAVGAVVVGAVAVGLVVGLVDLVVVDLVGPGYHPYTYKGRFPGHSNLDIVDTVSSTLRFFTTGN